MQNSNSFNRYPQLNEDDNYFNLMLSHKRENQRLEIRKKGKEQLLRKKRQDVASLIESLKRSASFKGQVEKAFKSLFKQISLEEMESAVKIIHENSLQSSDQQEFVEQFTKEVIDKLTMLLPLYKDLAEDPTYQRTIEILVEYYSLSIKKLYIPQHLVCHILKALSQGRHRCIEQLLKLLINLLQSCQKALDIVIENNGIEILAHFDYKPAEENLFTRLLFSMVDKANEQQLTKLLALIDVFLPFTDALFSIISKQSKQHPVKDQTIYSLIDIIFTLTQFYKRRNDVFYDKLWRVSRQIVCTFAAKLRDIRLLPVIHLNIVLLIRGIFQNEYCRKTFECPEILDLLMDTYLWYHSQVRGPIMQCISYLAETEKQARRVIQNVEFMKALKTLILGEEQKQVTPQKSSRTKTRISSFYSSTKFSSWERILGTILLAGLVYYAQIVVKRLKNNEQPIFEISIPGFDIRQILIFTCEAFPHQIPGLANLRLLRCIQKITALDTCLVTVFLKAQAFTKLQNFVAENQQNELVDAQQQEEGKTEYKDDCELSVARRILETHKVQADAFYDRL